jgi:pyruvate/2-oxoglutarate dehydrogenase complex dihydrolipoamide acyltransferase (E2) component
MFNRLIPAAAVAVTLLVPAVSQADNITFGSRLDHEPSNSAPGHNCREDGSDDPTPTCTRVGIDESIAVPAGLTAPVSGTIVRFSVRAGAPGQLTFRAAELTGLGYDPILGETTAFGFGAGTGPTVNVQGKGFDETGNPIESFPASMHVEKGAYLAIDSTSNSTQYCASGGAKQLIFDAPLGPGAQHSSRKGGCDLLVQAELVPDGPTTTAPTDTATATAKAKAAAKKRALAKAKAKKQALAKKRAAAKRRALAKKRAAAKHHRTHR